MKRIIEPNPIKVETEFTDAMLTGNGVWSVLARLARGLGLLRLLAGCVSVKERARGASDGEMLWSLVASLSSGNGSLSDLDALSNDPVGKRLLGLGEAPTGRRLGEWLSRLGKVEVRSLWGVAREFARRVAPAVVGHELETRGYVPVFADGTGIEVDGHLFQWARKLYDGRRGYWMHGVFVGGLWVSGRLCPGGVDVALGWRGQLERDVAPLLLVAAQYGLLPKKARRHGLPPLIRHLVRTVARLVRTGRQWRLYFAKNNFRLEWLYRCATQLE